MSITAIDSSTTTTTSSSSTSSAYNLSTSDFLKLLLAELENQDPTDPVDVSEMTSLFSSLTLVSEAETTNEYLSTLVDSMSSLSSNQAVSYLGKTITYTDSNSSKTTAVVSSVEYEDSVAYLVTEGGDKVKLSSVTGVS
jgi:flagellar basal-body rod modification protein FlgD